MLGKDQSLQLIQICSVDREGNDLVFGVELACFFLFLKRRTGRFGSKLCARSGEEGFLVPDKGRRSTHGGMTLAVMA